jgi:MYXO-CTERM domain-containing protein
MVALLSISFTAQAHEALVEPVSRYDSDGFSANKACPCGLGPNNQLCSEATTSDPNRSTRINEYDAGETITVSLHEVVGHSGRWRIAFDPDGADMLDEADPAGSVGNTGKGDLWEWQITLPSEPCDNCTLQVLQIMNGNTVDPVADPTGQSTYYQCADLLLVGTGTDTGGTGDTAATPAETADTATGTGTGTTPTTPTTPTGGDSGTPDDTGDGDEAKGCGCSGVQAPAGLAWAPLALLWLGRTRRR